MKVRYKFVRIYRHKDLAEAGKKRLIKQGYKAILLTEKLRDNSYQYVLYRSREKVK